MSKVIGPRLQCVEGASAREVHLAQNPDRRSEVSRTSLVAAPGSRVPEEKISPRAGRRRDARGVLAGSHDGRQQCRRRHGAQRHLLQCGARSMRNGIEGLGLLMASFSLHVPASCSHLGRMRRRSAQGMSGTSEHQQSRAKADKIACDPVLGWPSS